MSRTEVRGGQILDASVSLTADVTGTLPVANGGTGSASLTANYVLLGNGTGALQVIAPSTAGNVLMSNGTTWGSTALLSTISTASSATPTPTGDARENELYVTACTVGMTIAAPTGTPANGNKLLVAIFTAASQTLAYNAIYATIGVTPPSATVAGKWTYLHCKYNSTASKWHLLAVGQEA